VELLIHWYSLGYTPYTYIYYYTYTNFFVFGILATWSRLSWSGLPIRSAEGSTI